MLHIRAHRPHCLGTLVGALLLLLQAVAPAQCQPFSRRGLQEIEDWGVGSSLTLGVDAANEPGLSIQLVHDPVVGARLQSSSHRHQRPDGKLQVFNFNHLVPTGSSPGLWQGVLRPRFEETPYPVGPEHASSFEIYTRTGRSSTQVVMCWGGISVPGVTCCDDFWFEVSIRQSCLDGDRLSFEARMGRMLCQSGGTELTLDEVQVPVIYTQQPGVDLLKARILVPAAQNVPLPAANMPMSAWQVLAVNADLEHPARGQQMQFSGLYGGENIQIESGNEVYSPYQKILYFATEDNRGYYKRFQHSVVTAATGAYYRWAPTYYPEHGAHPTRNVLVTPYPAVMKALHAKSNAWWFDLCTEYREFVRRRMGIAPMRSFLSRVNKDAAGGESVVVATINLQNDPGGDAPVFADYVDHGIALQEAFASPSGRPAKVFLEWQKWFKGESGSTEDLIGPGFNPRPYSGVPDAPKEFAQAAREEIERAAQNDINICLYTLPTIMNNQDWSSFDEDWFLRDRSGAVRERLDGADVDFGNPVVPFWMTGVFFDDILDASPALGGLYLDFFGGEASYRRFHQAQNFQAIVDPWSHYSKLRLKLFKRRDHNGAAFVRGGMRTLDLLRGRVRLGQLLRRSKERPFLPTEAVMEYFAGRYDVAQHGLKAIPGHTQMSATLEQFAGLSADPLPLQAAANNPPLWNAVYHDRARADALGMMLSTEAVSQLVGGDADVGGVDWGTWSRYNRMIHALMFVGGMKSSLFSFYQDFAESNLVQPGANGPVLQDDSVVEQAQLLAFLQRMHQAGARCGEAAELVNFGVMERPLDLPQIFLLPGAPPTRQLFFFPGTVDSEASTSPTMAVNTLPLSGITRHYNEDFFTSVFPSQVPRVLHSVWRSSPYSKRLGLVLVNWSDAPAYWQATFNPAAYEGFGSDFRVLGVKPDGAGVEEYALGESSGATLLGFSDAPLPLNLVHHGAAAPGLMPPRSVQVIYLEPK